jgi:hypothetical protein
LKNLAKSNVLVCIVASPTTVRYKRNRAGRIFISAHVRKMQDATIKLPYEYQIQPRKWDEEGRLCTVTELSLALKYAM